MSAPADARAAEAARAAAERAAKIRRALLVTLLVHLAAASAKILVGLASSLLGLTADGVHSVLDSLHSVIGLVAVSSAARPPDSDHPYGHRKFETFATLFISGALGVAGFGLAQAGIERLRTQAAPATGPLAYAVVAAAILVDGAIAVFKRRRGRALASEFLLASAQDSRVDVLISLGVLGSMVAVDMRAPRADVVATIAVAGVIGWTAISLLSKTLGVLSDHAAFDVAEIERVVRGVPGVRACHKIRTRGPDGYVFADLHVQVDPDATVREGHRIAHEVVDALRLAIPGIHDVVTHLEPFEGARAP